MLCLAGAFLPKDALDDILEMVGNLFGIAAFVFNVVNNGINVSGDLILAVFGWVTFSFEDGSRHRGNGTNACLLLPSSSLG